MDVATLLGIVGALVAILGGFVLDGGHLESILQPTAALIVGGGTLGAMLVQFPLSHIKKAIAGAFAIVVPTPVDLLGLVDNLVELARRARREGIVALENEIDRLDDEFFRKALALAVDGSEAKVVRDAMEVALDSADEEGEAPAKVFEAGGGYAPTAGILGAVLGLIQVMENITEPEKLGAGIAVAFVATVYGVMLANLFFLPMAGKLKIRHRRRMLRYELIISGVCAIVDGDNPRLIEQKLLGYCDDNAFTQASAKAA